MTITNPPPLTLDEAVIFASQWELRRANFPDEPEFDAMMVMLLNWGDFKTTVRCVGPETWNGSKMDISTISDDATALPLCPQGHPLIEYGPHYRLGLVLTEDL